MVRSAGTVVGDFLASNGVLGLSLSTLLSRHRIRRDLWLWNDAGKLRKPRQPVKREAEDNEER